MKIAFAQYYHCLLNIDKNVAYRSADVTRRYCQLNGYNYIFEDIIKRWRPFTTITEALWYRFILVRNILQDKRFDYIVFSDLDCVPVNPNKKIEEVIEDKYDVIAAKSYNLVEQTLNLQKATNFVNMYLSKHNKQFVNSLFEFGDAMNRQYNIPFLSYINKIAYNPYGLSGKLFIIKCNDDDYGFMNRCRNNKPMFAERTNEGIGLEECEMFHLLLDDKAVKKLDIGYLGKMVGQIQGRQPKPLEEYFDYNEDLNRFVLIDDLTPEQQQFALDIVTNNKWWRNKIQQ